MKKRNLTFLKNLLETPSPTGNELPAAALLRQRLAHHADEVTTDMMGSVHAVLKGTEKAPSLMLAAHMDEIGLMVTYVSDEGFLSVAAVGGVDAGILPGMRVDIHTQSGVLRGVVGRKPIHLIKAEDRKTVTPLDQLVIDVGMPGERVRELVRIGDTITFGVGFELFGDGMAVSRAFDDKVGVWIAVRVLEKLAKRGRSKGDFIVAATVQEEIGTRGAITSAYGINPDVALAFDVTHATDYPGIEKTKYGDIVCGKGPVIARGPNINPVVFDRLVAAAEAEGVSYQLEAEPSVTGTDARAIQVTRSGIPCGLISVPLRYMHTPTEVVALSDLKDTVKVILRFMQDLDENSCFVPGMTSTGKQPVRAAIRKESEMTGSKNERYDLAGEYGEIAAGEVSPDEAACKIASVGDEGDEARAMDAQTTIYEAAAEALEKTEADATE